MVEGCLRRNCNVQNIGLNNVEFHYCFEDVRQKLVKQCNLRLDRDVKICVRNAFDVLNMEDVPS
eukprot:7203222-Pyramimonas_sp.AAC.1